MKKSIYLFAIAALTLTSCQKEEAPTPAPTSAVSTTPVPGDYTISSTLVSGGLCTISADGNTVYYGYISGTNQCGQLSEFPLYFDKNYDISIVINGVTNTGHFKLNSNTSISEVTYAATAGSNYTFTLEDCGPSLNQIITIQ